MDLKFENRWKTTFLLLKWLYLRKKHGCKYDGGLLSDVKKRFASEQKKNVITKIFRIQKSVL